LSKLELAKHSNKYPLEAITLLFGVITQAKDTWWSPRDEHKEQILRAAIASDIPLAMKKAIELIEYWGEHSDFYWAKFLPKS
jgi:6-phosphogluconolactonase/glucosamine-6-phosphate isomerase/deaminase